MTLLIYCVCIYENNLSSKTPKPVSEESVSFQSEDIDVVRELVFEGLCIYLHEDPAHVLREYVVSPTKCITKDRV